MTRIIDWSRERKIMTETQTVETIETRTEKLERRVRLNLEKWVENAAERNLKFQEKVAQNLTFALQYAGTDVELDVIGRAASRVLNVADNPNHHYTILDALEAVVQDFEKDLINFFGMNSTSKFSNAVDYHRLSGEKDFLTRTEFFMWELRDIRAEEKRQKDIKDTTTDATVHLFDSQRASLCKQIFNVQQEMDNAKTKRDRLAAIRAEKVLKEALLALDTKAEEMDLY
jgi:hypothetical protein